MADSDVLLASILQLLEVILVSLTSSSSKNTEIDQSFAIQYNTDGTLGETKSALFYYSSSTSEQI